MTLLSIILTLLKNILWFFRRWCPAPIDAQTDWPAHPNRILRARCRRWSSRYSSFLFRSQIDFTHQRRLFLTHTHAARKTERFDVTALRLFLPDFVSATPSSAGRARPGSSEKFSRAEAARSGKSVISLLRRVNGDAAIRRRKTVERCH